MASWQRLLVVRSRVGLSRAAVVAALLAATVVLGGCAPAAAPKPTPTPLFTSEADAFKAAEQVYRDYTEAGNAENRGVSAARPDDYLAGAALDEEVSTRRQLQKQKLHISGEIKVVTFAGNQFDAKTSRISASVCLDVSQARVLDGSDQDVTPKERPSRSGLEVTFTRVREGLAISKSTSSEKSCSASGS